jgi:hypothetical protein
MAKNSDTVFKDHRRDHFTSHALSFIHAHDLPKTVFELLDPPTAHKRVEAYKNKATLFTANPDYNSLSNLLGSDHVFPGFAGKFFAQNTRTLGALWLDWCGANATVFKETKIALQSNSFDPKGFYLSITFGNHLKSRITTEKFTEFFSTHPFWKDLPVTHYINQRDGGDGHRYNILSTCSLLQSYLPSQFTLVPDNFCYYRGEGSMFYLAFKVLPNQTALKAPRSIPPFIRDGIVSPGKTASPFQVQEFLQAFRQAHPRASQSWALFQSLLKTHFNMTQSELISNCATIKELLTFFSPSTYPNVFQNLEEIRLKRNAYQDRIQQAKKAQRA